MDLIDKAIIDQAVVTPSIENIMMALMLIAAKENEAKEMRDRLMDGLKQLKIPKF